jgi:hypothetical protein
MITAIFTLLSALYDKGKRFENHAHRFIFRAVIVFLISIIETPTILVGIWKPTLFQFLFNIAIFYGIFDYTLNILEKRKWNYIGSTSKIDQFINKYGNWKIQFIIKILFIIVTFVLKFKII